MKGCGMPRGLADRRHGPGVPGARVTFDESTAKPSHEPDDHESADEDGEQDGGANHDWSPGEDRHPLTLTPQIPSSEEHRGHATRGTANICPSERLALEWKARIAL